MNGWGAWNGNWSWALVLIPSTIVIHVAVIAGLAIGLERARGTARGEHGYSGWKAFFRVLGSVAVIALILTVVHALECAMWTVAYTRLGAFASPAQAALYSVDSMTTRGASDLHPEEHWRLLGATESLDGMLLFGISTAFLFYVMARLWRLHHPLD
jgi:hypothetical protein